MLNVLAFAKVLLNVLAVAKVLLNDLAVAKVLLNVLAVAKVSLNDLAVAKVLLNDLAVAKCHTKLCILFCIRWTNKVMDMTLQLAFPGSGTSALLQYIWSQSLFRSQVASMMS